jgi:hypothetical protein
MAPGKRLEFAVFLLALTWFTQSAVAIPMGGVLEAECSGTLDVADGLAMVECAVYSYESSEYVYTYQISNSSSVGLSFFSVGIASEADAYDLSYDTGAGLVDPAYWTIVGSPVQSVDALFTDTIDNDGLSSAVLWFKSTHAPDLGNVMVFGTSSGAPHSATGEVLAPSATPEPATIMLLGFGGALMTTARRKRNS